MLISKDADFILFIDSGIGGLSVYYEVKLLLPDINYIYLSDNAAFPYGEKRDNFIITRIINIIKTISKKYNLIMVVIACNTASVISLSVIKTLFPFIIIGIKPAIKLATKITRNGNIGLLATKATIHGKYTKNIINRFINFYNIRNIVASDLVLLAENKFSGKIISKNLIKSIVNDWLYGHNIPDTIILGCTHFSFLLEELKAIFSSHTIFVDYNLLIARKVYFLLKKKIFCLKVKKNVVFYTKMDSNFQELLPFFKNYGFSCIKLIDINN